MPQKKICLTCKNAGCVLKCRFRVEEPGRPAKASKEG